MNTCCLLPTAYRLLPTAYCLLPLAKCLLPTAYCQQPACASRIGIAGGALLAFMAGAISVGLGAIRFSQHAVYHIQPAIALATAIQ